jgi:hypothetical protein
MRVQRSTWLEVGMMSRTVWKLGRGIKSKKMTTAVSDM